MLASEYKCLLCNNFRVACASEKPDQRLDTQLPPPLSSFYYLIWAIHLTIAVPWPKEANTKSQCKVNSPTALLLSQPLWDRLELLWDPPLPTTPSTSLCSHHVAPISVTVHLFHYRMCLSISLPLNTSILALLPTRRPSHPSKLMSFFFLLNFQWLLATLYQFLIHSLILHICKCLLNTVQYI